jgi:hypothetical protein
MLSEDEYDDVIVTIAHPWGDVLWPLSDWIATGPGPRPLVAIIAAKRRDTGEPIDMAEIPLEYHNTRKSRRLQRLGQLPTPWGAPPDDSPPPQIDADTPPAIRKIIMEAYYD